MDATVTNAITNALHAFFLLLYFLGAARHHRIGRGAFTIWVVRMFALLFVVKVMGVYVHYRPIEGADVAIVWSVIAVMVVVLNGLIIHIVCAPRWLQVAAVLLSAGAATGLVLPGGNFTYLALPSAFVFIIAALYSQGTLRLGFWLVVLSNVVWIAARQLTGMAMGHEVPIALRYDNDAYHFLLIASTFVIYKGFARNK